MRAYSAIAALLLLTASAAAAQTVQVSGRLIDRTTGLPVEGGNVRVDSGAPAGIGVGGVFRVNVAPGLRRLSVRALGYAPWERELAFARDTTLIIDLEARPFALDTVRARSRMADARISIRDSTTRRLLADVHLTTSIGETQNSGHRGIVTLRAPVGERIQVYLTAFGYLPRVTELEVRGDTSITVMLPVDSIAIRMIGHQIARLEERRKGRAVAAKPPITREQLVKFSDPGMYTLLQRQRLLDRVACVLVDEVHWPSRVDFPLKARLQALFPERIERVELLMLPTRSYMMRIYTREFIREMMAGRVELKPVSAAGNGRFCR